MATQSKKLPDSRTTQRSGLMSEQEHFPGKSALHRLLQEYTLPLSTEYSC